MHADIDALGTLEAADFEALLSRLGENDTNIVKHFLILCEAELKGGVPGRIQPTESKLQLVVEERKSMRSKSAGEMNLSVEGIPQGPQISVTV